ncbi:MAG TPA: hypothetical protein VHB72_03945 [Candidatus Saccharimonadales bacterium]|jgi:hypothetical protein|nr:hypothetical protein [Candidatus Saccharimonadales bacterium]
MAGEISSVPPAIQCQFDPSQICPLRQALHEMAELKQKYPLPPVLPESREAYDMQKSRIERRLSRDDQIRLHSIRHQLTPDGRTDIIPDSCVSGPEKSMLFFGKMACGAQTEFKPWQFPPIELSM